MPDELRPCVCCAKPDDGVRTAAGDCLHCGSSCPESHTLCVECQAAGLCPVCGA